MSQIVDQLRDAWPTAKIVLRANSGFAREELMSWCESHGVDFVSGLAKNQRLQHKIAPQAASAKRLHEQTVQPERVFTEFWYQTWGRPRRVIGKANQLRLWFSSVAY